MSWRSSHLRVSKLGNVHTVRGHAVAPRSADHLGLGASPSPTATGSYGITYNAVCPVCGDPVYFFAADDGGRVFFDDLGPPWPKHPCTLPDAGTATSASSGHAPAALTPLEAGAESIRIAVRGGRVFLGLDEDAGEKWWSAPLDLNQRYYPGAWREAIDERRARFTLLSRETGDAVSVVGAIASAPPQLDLQGWAREAERMKIRLVAYARRASLEGAALARLPKVGPLVCGRLAGARVFLVPIAADIPDDVVGFEALDAVHERMARVAQTISQSFAGKKGFCENPFSRDLLVFLLEDMTRDLIPHLDADDITLKEGFSIYIPDFAAIGFAEIDGSDVPVSAVEMTLQEGLEREAYWIEEHVDGSLGPRRQVEQLFRVRGMAKLYDDLRTALTAVGLHLDQRPGYFGRVEHVLFGPTSSAAQGGEDLPWLRLCLRVSDPEEGIAIHLEAPEGGPPYNPKAPYREHVIYVRTTADIDALIARLRSQTQGA